MNNIRMQQLLSKKNRANVDIMKAGARSKLSGSLNDREKTGRLTDSDTMALLAVTNNSSDMFSERQALADQLEGTAGDSYIIKELLGARADNVNHKLQMRSDISVNGATNMSEYTNKFLHSGQALNTLDTFLIGAGLKSDLITETLLVKHGINVQSKDKE